MNETQIFESITLLSSYIYIKEKYEREIENVQNSEDLENILKLMLKLERYSHLADREDVIESSYLNILSRVENGKISESSLAEEIKELVSEATDEEKTYILNSVIFVAKEDSNISDIELGLIKQVSSYLGLKNDIKQIMNIYNASEFSQKISNSMLTLIFIFIISLMIYGGYLYYSNAKSNINIFDKKRIVFSEISYNRYVVYQNKFNIENSHFLKQAIFYMSGTVEVGVDTDSLHYDAKTKVLTVKHKKDEPFIFELNADNALVVDKIDPQPISKEEATNLSVGIGLAGAVGSGVIGSKLSTFLPTPIKGAVTVASGAVGGLFAGRAAYMLLNGFSLSKKITKAEESKIEEKANTLIKTTIQYDEDMLKIHKANFETFIKLKYASYGKELNDIQYEVIK